MAEGVFRLKSKIYALPLATVLTIGLTGCGNNDGAAGDRETDEVIPIGYYSNENHGNNGGNVRINEENDGPLTEFMDHTFGTEGNQNKENGNETGTRNTNAPRAQKFSRNDINYHGHLNDINGGARSSYFTAYDGNLMKTISSKAASIENVNDARAVIHENKVILAAVLKDYHREKETVNKIRSAVEPSLDGKSLKILTKESDYSRIKSIDNTLRDGGPKDQVEKDIKNLFQTMY